MPVTEAIHLLRIDREDGESPFHETLDNGAARCLDSNGYRLGLTAGEFIKVSNELGNASTAVFD